MVGVYAGGIQETGMAPSIDRTHIDYRAGIGELPWDLAIVIFRI
jgi:hypothetical protein